MSETVTDPNTVEPIGESRALTSVTVDRSWWSAQGVHGGHLAGLALGAMRTGLTRDQPARSLTARFLAPAGERPIDFDVAVHRDGAGSSVTSCTALQGNRTVLIGSALFGVSRPGPLHDGQLPPRVPEPQLCEPIELPPALAAFAQHLRLRAATAARPLAAGDRPELVMWLRFEDGRALDAESVVLLTDALPPALYAVWDTPRLVPSADLTVHFGDALDEGPVGGGADDGWALVRIRTEHAGSSWAVDDSTVWSADGRLLALARQARRVMPGRT
jgi:acyl-CoA thioesterase